MKLAKCNIMGSGDEVWENYRTGKQWFSEYIQTRRNRNYVEMQTIRPQTRSTETETPRVEPSNLNFNKISRFNRLDSDTCSCMRTTHLDIFKYKNIF